MPDEVHKTETGLWHNHRPLPVNLFSRFFTFLFYSSKLHLIGYIVISLRMYCTVNLHLVNFSYQFFSVSPITNLTCRDAFYSSSSRYYSYDQNFWRYTIFSTKLSSRDLIQTVRCPKGCQNRHSSNIRIYGSSEYTDTSFICPSAIHNGTLTGKKVFLVLK